MDHDNIKNIKLILVLIILIGLTLTSFPVMAAGGHKGVFKIWGDVLIPANTSISGDAVSVFGSVEVQGNLSGDAVAVMGDVIVRGKVEGDAVSVGGKVLIEEGAILKGEIVQVGPGIKVHNQRYNYSTGRRFYRPIFKIFNLVAIYALGMLLLMFFPNNLNNITLCINRNLGRKILFGFIAIILFVPLIVLTAISIIGIPLIPVIIIIFAIGAFLGYMGISLYVGNKLEELVKWEIPEYLKLIIGITILWLANRAPLIGFIVFIVIIVIGVGAVIETRFGTIKQ